VLRDSLREYCGVKAAHVNICDAFRRSSEVTHSHCVGIEPLMMLR